jgi:hypothetical protein
VLTHILSQFLKATLIDLGFIVSMLIQHLYVKINLANKLITTVITIAIKIYAFPIIYKNVKGA